MQRDRDLKLTSSAASASHDGPHFSEPVSGCYLGSVGGAPCVDMTIITAIAKIHRMPSNSHGQGPERHDRRAFRLSKSGRLPDFKFCIWCPPLQQRSREIHVPIAQLICVRCVCLIMKTTVQQALMFIFASSFALAGFGSTASSDNDPENATGQSSTAQGSGQPHPANPAEGNKPLLPGDQPAKQGTDPSSQVHNVDPRDLEGKKHKN